LLSLHKIKKKRFRREFFVVLLTLHPGKNRQQHR
jgi:hypothetical protein